MVDMIGLSGRTAPFVQQAFLRSRAPLSGGTMNFARYAIMRMRKKKNLIPRMERCAHVLAGDGASLRGNWRSLLRDSCALHVELGCGKGRFTAETARLHPDVLFIAVERVPDAMVIAMERVCALGLENVRFLSCDAARLPELFAEGEIDRIYINFCDPWPTKRHAKRRLTHKNFLKLYRTVLKERGEIHFKTDNAPLFAFSVEEFPTAGFSLSEVTDDLHANGPTGVMTDYEAKFYELGTPIHRCVATMEPWTEPEEPPEWEHAPVQDRGAEPPEPSAQ